MTETIRKKLMAVILTLVMMISFMPAMTLTVEAADITPSTSLSGSGTADVPFEIASAADLAYMRNQVNAGGTITPSGEGTGVEAKTAHYKLTVDIVLGYWQDDGDGIVDDGEIYDSASGGTAYSASNWSSIGSGSTYYFAGTFDGNGCTVSGIYINETITLRGLFGWISANGTVKNVGVKDSYIKGGNDSSGGCVGGIAGINKGTIQYCYNTGSVSSTKYVGAVAGINEGTIQYCYNTGSVSGTEHVGGVTGRAGLNATVSGCYNTGSVSGTENVGGVTGGVVSSATVSGCYNTGSVSGTENVGGVAGSNSGTVTGCYYDKQMCPVGGINGGDIVGSAEGKLTSEITSGAVFTGWSGGETEIWNFTAGLYPRLTGYVDADTDYEMDVTDAAYVSSSPVFLAATDTTAMVKSNLFTLSTASGVSWSSSDERVVSIDGSSATVNGDGSVTLTASLGDFTKSVTLKVDITAPILQSAARDSDTQITVTLSEPCLNLTNENDGGFTVTKTGTEETFAVSQTAQGANASQVVLTVADMATAGVKGVTVTYTAGPNGTITDIAGNPLATNSTGVVITPWAPKLGTPGTLSWDETTPAKATWGAAANASSYTVQLYKGGIASGSPLTNITNTYYDFTSAITETGSYTFTVQAIGDGATYSDSDVSSKSPEYSYTSPIKTATVNITAPAAGAAPQTADQVETATANADYTVTNVVWNEALTAGDKFKAGQVYTATVTLTSKNGKEFQAAPFTPAVASASSVGTTTTAGTGIGNTVTFTVTFSATAAQSVTAITVKTQPTKLIYTAGELLDLAGLAVTLTYNDGSTADIPYAQFGANGITANPDQGTVMDIAAHDGKAVTLTCSAHTAATGNLTVNPVIIAEAGVTGITAPVAGAAPAAVGSLTAGDTSYTVTGLTWQNSGGSAAALTAGGKFKAASTYQAVIELTAAAGYKFQALTAAVNVGTAGAGTINEEAAGNKLTFTVTFTTTEAQSVTAIAVKIQPTKLTYTAGETLDLAGLVAALTYNDTSTLDVALADFEANGITANPSQGTEMEIAAHNGQAVTLTCSAHTATTGNLTVSAAPTYEITLSETGTYTFTAQTAGYMPVAPITATVTRIGTGNITNLAAALGGADAGDFTLGALDAATLDGTTTFATFTVKPNDALAPGTYLATVTVTADNGVSKGFNLSFTVNAPSAPTIQSAAAGDTHVNITWSSVPEATGYKIYQSTTSGSYGSEDASVAGTVYSYDAIGLINGTTYFFVVRASTGLYDSVNSNEVSSTPQVPAPGAPILQTAAAGNGQVSLTWSTVEGSLGYKVYASMTSGAYTSPVDTVTGSVYSCDVTGLINGTTYYFAVTASNPGGESGYSNEISAIPQAPVPGAPTGVTATAGNGQATVSFTPPADNGGSAITGYTVTSSSGNITATGTDTTIIVTGLTNGTAYTFTVAASNAAGTGPASEASNSVTPYRPSNGGSDDSSTPSTPASPTQPENNGVDIIVNGKTETAATAATTQEGDKTVITVVVDDNKVEQRLAQEGNNAVVTIPVNNGADVVVGTLNGQTVKNMENIEAVLEIKTENITYTIPASQINIDAVSAQIGEQIELKDIAVSVKISEPAADTVKIVEDTANENNYQIIVKPIEFEITCSIGSKTIEVSKFSAYVERMIAIPEGVDPSKITTGVILNSDGTFSHVPTVITMIDGKYYAKINSLTNSTYSLISSPKTFKDVGTHWAREAVNDMASRLVVSGVGEDKFEPDRDITRAEFAAIAVRALGLMRPGTGKDIFSDVSKDVWYYDAVSIAYEYGLIAGYGNGQFGPMDKITREQAMTMIARAMKITGLEAGMIDSGVNKALVGFTDANSAADYAKEGIAACVKTEIVSGRSKTTLAPKDNITRAEVAVIVRRLLQQSGLI